MLLNLHQYISDFQLKNVPILQNVSLFPKNGKREPSPFPTDDELIKLVAKY